MNFLAGIALTFAAFSGLPPFPAAHHWRMLDQRGVYIKGMRLW